MSKLRITPLGTCRIHTPLRRASTRFPIDVDWNRNYGFVHTSEEAVQLARFLAGEEHFRPEIAPLLIRDGALEYYDSQQWQPSDLHVVEISSTKRLASGSFSVQSNYVYRHFADFFANPARSRMFWTLVKKGHRADLIKFLREQPAYRLLSPSDRELLVSLTMEQQSFNDIKANMGELVERLGRDKVLFVTHVNATTPDGAIIPTRDRLIRWVKLIAGQLDTPVFDPTPSMRETGQELALEKGGLDLAHYTPTFYDKVYEDLHRFHTGAMIGSRMSPSSANAAEDQVELLAAHLETMLETGDFFATSREIHAAVQKSPDALPLVELRGRIRSQIGDYPGAIADLSRRNDESAMSLGLRIALLDAAAETEDYDRALKVAENLISDEFDSPDIYRMAAKASEHLGRTSGAVSYAKQAFRKDRSDLASALQALVLLNDRGEAEQAAEWRQEILDNLGEAGSGTFEIGLWAVAHHDDHLLTAILGVIATSSKGAVVDLIEDAFNAGMYEAVADSVPVLVRIGRISRTLSERRLALLNLFLAKAEELLNQQRTGEGYRLAFSIMQIEDFGGSQIPRHRLAGMARRITREIVKSVRLAIREAHSEGRSTDVLRLGEAAGDVIYEHVDTAVAVARTLQAVERPDEALGVMKRAEELNPDNFAAIRWTGRLASIGGDYTTALLMYGRLRRFPSSERKAIESEMDRFFTTIPRRAHKQLREFVDNWQFEAALQLATIIEQELGPDVALERAMARMSSMLRVRLKEIDDGDAERDEREGVLRQLLSVRPNEQRYLRLLALDLMRTFRFAEAAEVWGRLSKLDPANETVTRNRERCSKLAERRMATSSSDMEVAA